MKKRVLYTLLLLMLLLVGGGVTQVAAAPTRVGPTDPAELERFLDVFFAHELANNDIPGAVFVMVKDGQVFFAKGYGYADLEQQTPYDPTNTIVRAGSIVKTVTATAALQLAEQGQLDLYTDVNQYLTRFQVPDTFNKPITTWDLLHHTAGLDADPFGIRVDNPDDLLPLGDYLAEHLPPRLYPPGTIRHYNDFHIALAGHVIEAVSGQTYADYVQEHLFAPLEMNDSSFVLPTGQENRAALGYRYLDGVHVPFPMDFYYLQTAAGAGFNTTAMDLAHYMIAQLQDGQYEGTRILQAETAQELHTVGFRHHPYLPGMAYGFDEIVRRPYQILVKSGGAPGMTNRMVLILDQGVGFYVSYNRDPLSLEYRLEDALLQRYFPGSSGGTRGATLPNAAADASRYVGYYRELVDYSATSLQKIQSLTDQIQVTALADGSLSLFGSRMTEVEPGIYQWHDGNYAIFDTNAEGEVNYLYVNRTPFARIPWHETLPIQAGVVGFAVLVFLTTLIAWLIQAIRGQGRQYAVAGAVALLNLVFLVGFGLVMGQTLTLGGPAWEFTFGLPTTVILLLTLPLITTILTLVLMVQVVRHWLNSEVTLWLKVHQTVVVLGAAAFIFFLNTWNLLGYRV